MLKKAKAESEKAGAEGESSQSPRGKDIAERILKSSHSIWLAGLGAFAKAQQEGGKVFEALVKQGEALEQKTRQSASVTASAAREAALGKAKEMQQMAGGTWDKLEQVFEDRVARALSKLGVYTHNDVQQLAERVDQLAEAVNKLLESRRAQSDPARPGTAKAARRSTRSKAPAQENASARAAAKRGRKKTQ